MSKEINDKHLLELMEIAKNPIKEDEFKTLPPAKRFVMSSNIEAGTEKIPAILIYDRYLTWARSHKIVPISMIKFFQELALYFDKVKFGNGYAYLMSPKDFNLSPEYLAMVIGNRRKRISSSDKKKNKKERPVKSPGHSSSTENS